MSASISLTMSDGVQVVVPDSLNLITPYVLIEQQDWFEDEIKFLRSFLKPGQNVIDIGANYGVYTLTMAKMVGSTGRVWAFEPTSSTAKLLAEGIAANGFPQVVLEQSALSNACGTAQLSLNEHSELNALVHDKPATGLSETVPLITLDKCKEREDWRVIEFVKIDAEGEEANILKGGKRFFSEISPLIQYEINVGGKFNMELVQLFSSLGYNSYRLVPGLNLLVPFDAKTQADGFLLNLFCCKRDKAVKLAAAGFLYEASMNPPPKMLDRLKSLLKKTTNQNQYEWRKTIAQLPYGKQFNDLWEQRNVETNSAKVDKALAYYAISRDSSLTPGERFSALGISFNHFKILCDEQPAYMRLSSLARVAKDYGARTLAVKALQRLEHFIHQHRGANLCEPFLAPSERFDYISPNTDIENWVLASILEELEMLGHYSSFYTGLATQERLKTIRKLKFGSDEMERRLDLLHRRFELSAVQ